MARSCVRLAWPGRGFFLCQRCAVVADEASGRCVATEYLGGLARRFALRRN